MKNKLFLVIVVLLISVLFAFATTNFVSTSPANRTWTTDTTPSFTVNVTNNVSNNVTCELFINGAGYFRNTTVFNKTVTTLTANATLTQGTYQWYVNCTDVAPSTAKSSVRVFYLDTVNPVGTLNKPQNNTYGGNSVTFNFTGTDFDANLSYSLFINDRFNQSGYTQANDTDIILTVGGFANNQKYNWTVQLTDETNHMINFTSYFTGDTVSPSVNLSAVNNNTWSTDNTTALSFYITDNFNSSNRYTVYVDSVARNTSTVYNETVVSLTLAALSSGTHRVFVYAYDTARNTVNSSVLTLNIDNKLPTSVITSPVNNSWTTDTTPSINFTLTDDADTLLNYTLYANGVAYNKSTVGNNTAKVVAFTSALSEGVNRIVVEAMDNAGRRTNSTVRVLNIDNTTPIANLVMTSNNSWTSDNTPTVTFNITDNLDATLNYTVYVDSVARNTSVLANNTQLTLTLASLADGTHRIHIYSFDEAGNTDNSSVLVLKVDTTAPSANLVMSANNTWTTDTTPTITFNVTDALDNVLNYTVYVDSVARNRSVITNNTQLGITLASLTDGTHRIHVYSEDSAGNKDNSSVLVLKIDSTSPGITLNLPVNNSNVSSTTVSFNFTATDNIDTNLSYQLFVNGDLNRSGYTNTNNTDVTFSVGSFDADTEYNWTVEVTDNAGNRVNATVQYFNIVDTTAPSSAPAALNVSDSDSDGNIELSWLADANATYYRIYRNSTVINDATGLTALATVSGTTFEDNTTVNGTLYWYTVTSVDASLNENKSVASPSYNATANDSFVPRLPQNVNTTTLPNGTVLISWNATKRDVSGNLDLSVTYRVFRTTNRTALNTSSSVNNIGNTTNNYFYDINMTTGTNYTYVVAAIDDADNYNSSKTSYEAIVPAECTTVYTYGAYGTCSGGEKSRDGTRVCYGGGATEDTDTASCSSSGGGSGGSSGGSSSAASVQNPASVRIFNEIAKGKSAVMPVSNTEIGITEIKIEVNNDVSGVRITVEKLPGKPAEVETPSENVFKFLKIDKAALTDSNLARATLKFRVEKKWLLDNGLDADSVKLLRYNNGWNELKTSRLSEDETFIYYESVTPGFSYFAIAADKETIEEQEVIEPEAEIIEPTEEIIAPEVKEEIKEETKPAQEAKEKRPVWLLVLIIVVFAAAVFMFYIKGKKQHAKENLEKHKSSHGNTNHEHSKHHVEAHTGHDSAYDKIESELNKLRKR